jgi:hypothetical protein
MCAGTTLFRVGRLDTTVGRTFPVSHQYGETTIHMKYFADAGMNFMTACASCFVDDNLRIIIAECLDYADLCALELTARAWRTTSRRAFYKLRSSSTYKLRTFKDSSLYDTDKKFCASVYNSRSGLSDTLFLIGGSFGSPFTDTCSLADQLGSLNGTQTRSLNLPVRIGSAAFTQELDGSLLVLGGWNDADEVINWS